MNRSQKIREHLSAHPNANAHALAKKYKVSPSRVYQLRKELARKEEVFPETSIPDPAPVPGSPILGLLEGRGTSYGSYRGTALVAQALKRVLADHARTNNKTFTDTQWESLEMIATKMARIVNGDSDQQDSWADIAGYAQLIADELADIHH